MLLFPPYIYLNQQYLKIILKRYYWTGNDIFGCSALNKPKISEKINKEIIFENEEKVNNNINLLINAYRRYGHLKAEIDPLKLNFKEKISELNPKTYGLKEDEKEILFLIENLNKIYSNNIGVEFMHLKSVNERNFFIKIFENSLKEFNININEKIINLKLLLKMKVFDQFLALKFPTLKRYSGEGAESQIIFFNQLVEECPQYEIKEFIWGGAHRGRLALNNILFKYPTGQLFRKLRGLKEVPENIYGIGDVPTHLYSDFIYKTINNENVHVSTLPNPSHLEATIATLYGKARAKSQILRNGDYGGNIVGEGILAVQQHGDGAFTGQGIVWETLSMSQVPNFRIGGSIHLIVNNQIAFTADKNIGRSSIHCGNIALAIDCPLICVNSENILDVIKAAKIAIAYQQKFRKEIFIELICYRRYGHNELDEPRLTQPKMYNIIDKQKCMVNSFKEKLDNEGIFTKENSDNFIKEYKNELNEILTNVDNGKIPPNINHLCKNMEEFKQANSSVITKWDTGLNKELLKLIGISSVNVPKDFFIHPNLQRTHIASRLEKIENGNIDWSTAEALAIGSSLLQGFDVRLSGQDVGRGTFSQRHVMLVCQQTDKIYIPLNNIQKEQKHFLEIANSPLSEAAIVGFEYGFSIENPKCLVIWEAQFGDFYNGAQTQIDTLIASGESKWFLQNSLVLLLPHGYDGAGPDHSSSHIERFLLLTDSSESQELADSDNINIFITNPSTSAQYFHLLRKQIVTPYKKPLVIITPKILLRHSFSSSSIEDFIEGTTFQPVLFDKTIKDIKNIKKVIICSGKHSLTLLNERNKRRISDTAIVRLEGICPFPVFELAKIFDIYFNAKSFIWSQEEPRNAGCWPFIQNRFKNAFGINLKYAGRTEQAWIATAITEIHEKEILNILEQTFTL